MTVARNPEQEALVQGLINRLQLNGIVTPLVTPANPENKFVKDIVVIGLLLESTAKQHEGSVSTRTAFVGTSVAILMLKLYV